jgi:hypothetical protein
LTKDHFPRGEMGREKNWDTKAGKKPKGIMRDGV